jgi:hypothetical protein
MASWSLKMSNTDSDVLTDIRLAVSFATTSCYPGEDEWWLQEVGQLPE